jgi:ligand-binding sensor domain-containing protein/two-component sensor histidine kinase
MLPGAVLRLLWLLPCAVGAQAAVAESNAYGVDFWRESEGLAQSRIRAIAQTRDGYIWFGTDGGLLRFNGERITAFNVQSGDLKDNEVWALREDDEGALWIGTYGGGLTQLKAGRFRTFTTADGLPDDVVLGIEKDPEGNLWLVTPQGLARYSKGSLHRVTPDEGLPDVHATCIAPDAPGGPLIATRTGIYRYYNGRFDLFAAASAQYGFAERLMSAQDGSLWIGFSSGVIAQQSNAQQSNGRLRVVPIRQRMGGQIHRIYQDPHGGIWAAVGKGLHKFEDGEFRPVRTVHGTPALGSVYSVLMDREGGVWLGLQSNGVARLRVSQLSTLSEEDGLPDDRARSIYQDRSGRVWIGTADGLALYANGTVRAVTNGDGAQFGDVRSIAEDAGGRLWISAGKELLVHNGATFNRLPGWKPTHEIEALYRDAAGNMWVGTDGAGLFRYSGGRFAKFTSTDGLGSNHVRALLADRNGALWISTFGSGVTRYTAGRFTVFNNKNGFAGDRVVAMHEDEEGALWFATRQGLIRFANGAFFKWQSNSGLYSDFVYSIIDDGSGNFWFSSAEGIFRVPKKELRAYARGEIPRVTSIAYREKDGMKTRAGNLGNQPVAWRMATGQMLFSTMRGVVIVDPARLVQDVFVPPVYIEKAIINGREQPSGKPARVALDRGELEIHYSALSYADPGKLLFRYMLQGFDPDWIDAGNRRLTYYTNLPPGKYVFRVATRKADGDWTEAQTAFEAEFKPPFYRSTYFVPAVFAGLLLLAAGIYWLRTHELHERYAAVLAERSRISRDIHDTLSQNLTGIALQLDSVHMQLPDLDGSLRDRIEEACNLTRYSLAEARRAIVDLRSDGLETRSLEEALPELAGRVAPTLSTEVKVLGTPRRINPVAERNLLRILQEALTNTVRHAGASRIEVELHYAPDCLALSVRDDGSGFEPAQANGTRNGHFGLTCMRERAERIGGHLVLSSSPGAGTEIRVEAPL